MEKIILILFTVSCSLFTAVAQNIDSLIKVVNKAPVDTSTLNLFLEIIEIAPDGVWEGYNEKGINMAEILIKSNVPSIQKSTKFFLGQLYNNKALIYAVKGDYTTALDYYKKGEKLQEEIGDKQHLALTLNSIGAVYDRNGDITKALESYFTSLKLEEELNDMSYMPATMTNLGVLYAKKNQPDSSIFYFQKGLKIAEQIKLKDHIYSNLLHDMGEALLKKEDMTNAGMYFEKGLNIAAEIGDESGKSSNLAGLAEISFKKGEIKEAEKFAKQSVDIARKMKSPYDIKDAAKLLKEIYNIKGDFKNAYEMYSIEIAARDTLNSKENQKAVIRHQFQTDYEVKQAKLKAEQEKKDAIAEKEIQQQKIVRNSFIGGFAVVLLFAGVFFRQRNKISKGKKRSDELLLNILPAEVAEELKHSGEAEARHFDNVTVLFTDFVGFTLVSEKLTPKELVAEIHTYFTAFDKIMEKNGLEKIKTIGDAYLAICGLPHPSEDHAKRTVLAAMDIIAFIKHHETQGGKFNIRVGINSGSVVAGIVGVKKFAYDIWGDTVNTAARMEQNSVNGKINISESTYQLVKNDFTCVHRGKIAAKNKGEVDMYFVESGINN